MRTHTCARTRVWECAYGLLPWLTSTMKPFRKNEVTTRPTFGPVLTSLWFALLFIHQLHVVELVVLFSTLGPISDA